MQYNIPTRNNRNGGSRRANAPLATSEASPVTFNGGATSTRLFR